MLSLLLPAVRVIKGACLGEEVSAVMVSGVNHYCSIKAGISLPATHSTHPEVIGEGLMIMVC